MLPAKIKKILDTIYRDISTPEGLGSIKDLYNKAKTYDADVTLNNVYEYLKAKDSYTLYKRNPQNFSRRCMYFKRPGYCLCLDTMYVKPFDPKCKHSFFLILIDCFSRYVDTIPLKNLKTAYVAPILEQFLKQNIYQYDKIFSDRGGEVSGKKMLAMYKKLGISWYTTNSKNKTSIVERYIRTLKTKLSKFITEFGDLKLDNAVKNIVDGYNIRVHSSLVGFCPLDVHLTTDWLQIKKIASSIYKKCTSRIKAVKNPLKNNTVVRLKIESNNIFSNRAHNIVNTPELFVVLKHHKTTPVTYTVGELASREALQGKFYHNELVPALDSGVYRITVLKQKKIRKKTMFLIKYIDYPTEKHQWITGSQLKKFK